MTRSYGVQCFGILWWRFSYLQRCCVTMFAFVAFTIVRKLGGRFLSSGMPLQRMRRPCAYVVFALYSKLCQHCVALQQCSVSLGCPPSLRFLGLGSPSVPVFFLCFMGLFILLPLAMGAVVGGWGSCWGCWLVSLWVFFRLGV